MPCERRQFRILYRDLLRRMVDLELLSSAGDPGKLLAQFAAVLAALSLTFVVATGGKYWSGSAAVGQLRLAAQAEAEFLFATTMAVAGMLAVLAWNNVLPDRRDCMIVGVLPVRLRTLFLARIAAICTAVGTGVVATNAFTGLAYPFMLGTAGSGGLRAVLAWWIAAAAAGLFICLALLAVQGVLALMLSRRQFLRCSSGIQLAAFFAILGTYFLKPPLVFPLSSKSLGGSWEPSFWFYALFEQCSGSAPPILKPFAFRALWSLLLLGVTAAVAFSLAFHRSVRRVVEQPDLSATNGFSQAARVGRFLVDRVFPAPLDRAIFLFTARTLARSRQHRLLVAAFGGIGLAIGLAYAKDLVYGYSRGLFDSLGVNGAASRYWDRANVPLMVASLVLLAFAVIGVRAAFSLPLELGANWIFRVTTADAPASYFSAVRKTLLALSAVPVWIAAAAAFLLIWPIDQALEHVAMMTALGILLVEISLYRFRKIPFTCSYLPGKANLNVRLGVYAALFLFAADRGVALEYWAIEHTSAFLVLFAILLWAAMWARRRTLRFAEARGNRIQFEETPPAAIFALDLRSDATRSNDDDVPDALSVVLAEPSRSRLIGLNLGSPPIPDPAPEPAVPVRIRLEQLAHDLRHSARIFRNAPAFSAVTILLITLGLGANLTIYSIVRSVLSKPAPGVHAKGLVIFGQRIDGQLAPGGPLNSYPDYLDLAADTKTMNALAASMAAPWLTLALPDGTYEVRGEMVTANYFQTLGVPLVRGRSFTEEESRGIGGLSVVIAFHLWQEQFHEAGNVIGEHIIVNGIPATVVGITAEGFHGIALAPHFEIGLPLVGFSHLRGTEAQLHNRNYRATTILGRLAPHATLSQARAEFEVFSERLRNLHPDENRGWSLVLSPYSMTAFGPSSSPLAQRLMLAVGFIGFLALLVVCANVASLVLARSVARERELAVRLALGAPPRRILHLLLGEGLLISLVASLAAWPLTFAVTRAIGRLVPPLESGARFEVNLTPDGHVFGYGVALAILATLAFTLAPALGLWRRQALSSLKAAENTVSRRELRPMRTLVVGQVALSTVLVTTGSLAYQSLFHVDNSDLYFTKDDLLLASINTAGAAASGARNIALLERIRQRLRAIPGVTAASYATAAPPHDHGWMDVPVRAVGTSRSVLTDGTIAGPDYIHALGVPSLAGRDLSASDAAHGRPTAVINRRLAGELWPGESALGRTILLGEGGRPIEIVGMVPNGAFSGVSKDGSLAGMGKSQRPNFVFLSELPDASDPGERTLHIRYAGDLEKLVPEIRRAVHDVDARVPVFSVRTMDEEFRDFTASIRILRPPSVLSRC